MPTILSAALGAILRHVLTMGAGYLVAQGIWTKDESALYVGGATIFLLTLGWSVWQKVSAKRLQLVAQTMGPGVTEAQVIREVEHKKVTETLPSVLIAPDQPPTAQRG